MSSSAQATALTRRNPSSKEVVADVRKASSDRASILLKTSLDRALLARLEPVGPSWLERVHEGVVQTRWEFQDDFSPFWLLADSVALVAQNLLPLLSLLYLCWNSFQIFGTCIATKEGFAGFEMLCSFTIEHARCLPGYVMMACVNRAGYLMMHTFVYHQFLRFGVLIQYEHSFRSLLCDPIAYVLGWYLLFALLHLPVQLVYYHVDPIEEKLLNTMPSFCGKCYIFAFLLPVSGVIVNYLSGYSIIERIVSLSVFVGLGTGRQQNPAMAAHTLLRSTAQVYEREFQEADWDLILETIGNHDKVTVKDVVARIKEIGAVPLSAQNGWSPVVFISKYFKYLSSSWWTTRLVFDDRFSNEEFKQFRKYWALFAFVGGTTVALLFCHSVRRLLRIVGILKIMQPGINGPVDWALGRKRHEVILESSIRIVYILLQAWQVLGLLQSMRVRKQTAPKANVGIEMSSLRNGTPTEIV